MLFSKIYEILHNSVSLNGNIMRKMGISSIFNISMLWEQETIIELIVVFLF